MIKTEYFASGTYGMSVKVGNQNVSGADVAIENVKEKRDAFLKQNENIISEIVSEKIQFQICSGQFDGCLFAVITISYYIKN